jgi:two-component system nitrate/nitrite response regulator NarL
LLALIADNRLVRDGTAALIEQVPNLSLVGRVSSGDVSRLREAWPQVVLVYHERHGSSLRVAEQARRDLPDARIIVVDVPPAEEIREFVRLGVVGFVMKDATLHELVETIEAVVAGADVLPPELTPSLFSQVRGSRVDDAEDDADPFVGAGLTPREREVIELIAEGLGNDDIAARLDVSIYTVKSHVSNVMKKLTLHTRLQLAAYVHRGREDSGP